FQPLRSPGEAPSGKLHLSHAQAAVPRSDQLAFDSPPDSQVAAGYSAQPTSTPATVWRTTSNSSWLLFVYH
ncbi:hypothetical protein J6590_105976, partial [Homalodisca vitripennis]